MSKVVLEALVLQFCAISSIWGSSLANKVMAWIGSEYTSLLFSKYVNKARSLLIVTILVYAVDMLVILYCIFSQSNNFLVLTIFALVIRFLMLGEMQSIRFLYVQISWLSQVFLVLVDSSVLVPSLIIGDSLPFSTMQQSMALITQWTVASQLTKSQLSKV